jgi:hypothetical protein
MAKAATTKPISQQAVDKINKPGAMTVAQATATVPGHFTTEQVELIKRTIAKNATDDE